MRWDWAWGLPEGSPEGCVHSGDRGLAGDVGDFDPASGIPGELQGGADGYTLRGGIDIASIVAARSGVQV